MSDKPFEVPEIKAQAGFRPTERDRQNLRLLMVTRRVSSVSDILRWCVEQQAEPVRQAWQEISDRSTEESDD